jgi:lantibiotic modifying enzyme
MIIKLSVDSVNFSRSVYRLNSECRNDSYMAYIFQIIGLVNICILYSFYWAILWLLNFMCRRFGTLCLFHCHRSCGQEDDL